MSDELRAAAQRVIGGDWSGADAVEVARALLDVLSVEDVYLHVARGQHAKTRVFTCDRVSLDYDADGVVLGVELLGMKPEGA